MPPADSSDATASKSLPRERLIKRLFWRVAFVYIGLLMVLMLLETFLMYPVPDRADGEWAPQGLSYDEVDFVSSDGTRLHGWYSECPHAERTLLFCHGNGEHVAYLADEITNFQERYRASVLVFDYRGYGRSDGRPFEHGILADGEAALEWLMRRSGRPADQIVLWGRSLGGAVAVDLAAKHGAQCLVLDRTFSSMVDVAADKFPFLPVRLLLRNRYPSIERIKHYTGPLIQIHGQRDEIVPFRFGTGLFEACPSKRKEFIASPSLSHNDLWPQEIEAAVQDFLDRCDGAGTDSL